MPLDLMKIFDGYVRNYHTLKLTSTHGLHSYTMKEIEYFSRLGSMLGYWTFTEDKADGTSRAMDLSWWDNFVENENGNKEWKDLILHLERENFYKKDIETINKLFDSKRQYQPKNVIGIISVPNVKRVQELLKIAKKKCTIDNVLLIFLVDSDLVEAYLLQNCNVKSFKKALISEIAGILFMYFEEEYEK